jgi:hypothetical protein
MTLSAPRRLWVGALALAALLGTLPAFAAPVLAQYTLDFHPPSPNDCSNSGLGDLSGTTLAGAVNFATVDVTGSFVTANPGPTQISGVACGTSYSGSFSFDSGAGNSEVYVSFGGSLVHPPNPNISTYAFPAGTDPATLAQPDKAPWINLGVPVGINPGPQQLPLYAFQFGAYDVGMLTVSLTTVPLPAAAWLFGSGLLGLFGVARRKTV